MSLDFLFLFTEITKMTFYQKKKMLRNFSGKATAFLEIENFVYILQTCDFLNILKFYLFFPFYIRIMLLCLQCLSDQAKIC